jgi:hypothetical protein
VEEGGEKGGNIYRGSKATFTDDSIDSVESLDANF